MVTAARLAQLSKADRLAYEAWLADFDKSWTKGSLGAALERLPVTTWRDLALEEMIKIDMERRWQEKQPVRLEHYLHKIPELGTRDSISPEMVIAEYEIRRDYGQPAEISEYSKRFPAQFSRLKELIAALPAPSGRRSANHGNTETVSFAQSTPSFASSRPTPQQLPEQFGRYKILKKLGGGGMGTVYLAHDTQLDRQVALKVPHFSADDDPEAVVRFQREGRAAATLHHPNICPVYDVGQLDGIHFLTMAYIAGTSLFRFTQVASKKPIAERQVAGVVRKLALALHEAHARGVVHRDLKPSNIMIDGRREPIVMDFGLARRGSRSDEQLTQAGSILGTPAYMAPEQVRGDVQAMGPSCDIYSLGVILYELLTGHQPFTGQLETVLYKAVHEEPPDPVEHRADLDPRLAAICLRAMAKRAENRFASMAEFAAALDDYLRNQPSQIASPRRAAAANQGGRPPKRPRRWVAAAAAGAILFFAAVFYVATDHGTIKIVVNEPQADVSVDGEQVRIENLGEPITLRAGRHKLFVKRGDLTVKTREFVVSRGDNPDLIVTLQPREANDATGDIDSLPQPAVRSDQPDANMPAPNTAGEPTIAMNGLAGLRSLKPLSFPKSWSAQDDFARIADPGRISFPRVLTDSFVFEIELTLSQPSNGNVRFIFGDSESCVELWLGSLGWRRSSYPDEKQQPTTVPCELFRNQAFGWNSGNSVEHFPAGRRLRLKLLAADGCNELWHNNLRVLEQTTAAFDPMLEIIATGVPDCTIHQCAFREFTEDERRSWPWPWTSKSVPGNPVAAQKRIDGARAGLGDQPDAGKSFFVRSIDSPMVWIAPGEFTMGTIVEWESWGRGPHRVRLTHGYWIATFETTQQQWLKLFPDNPSRIRGSPYLPVNWISWEDGVHFCEAVNRREKDAGRLPPGYQYRLPTEAEWEYACRAGSSDNFSVVEGGFWSPLNGDRRLHEVGESKPNPWGLYDMHGNVPEWCLDVWTPYPKESEKTVVDPYFPSKEETDSFAIRGGSCWTEEHGLLSSFARDRSKSTAGNFRGFRIVLGPDLVKPSSINDPDNTDIQPPAGGRKRHAGSASASKGPRSGPLAKKHPKPLVAPFDAKQARVTQEAWARHLGLPVEQANSIGMKLMLIPPGEFLMGSTDEQVALALKVGDVFKCGEWMKPIRTAERPQHQVVLTKPFWMGATEVTVGQFRQFVEATKYVTEAERYGFGDSSERAIAKANDDDKERRWCSPGYPVSDELPVTQVSWNDACAFCNWLSEQHGLAPCYRRDGDSWCAGNTLAGTVTGTWGYRLPTEAEWEYACRAGSITQYGFSDDYRELEQFAWQGMNSIGRARPVGLKPANAFGLYDMHGNVWEWCQDYWDEAWYEKSPTNDPQGPSSGSTRVARGGSWFHFPPFCRSAFRGNDPPSSRHNCNGFRVVVTK
jgi:formylglycine-generating enzyme required for sulfatase activity